jgi:hypothetical protein
MDDIKRVLSPAGLLPLILMALSDSTTWPLSKVVAIA